LLGRSRMHVRANRSGARVRLLSMVPV
jgi:hypothetical protein